MDISDTECHDASYENPLLSQVYREVGTLVQGETGTNLPFFIPVVSDSLRHDA